MIKATHITEMHQHFKKYTKFFKQFLLAIFNKFYTFLYTFNYGKFKVDLVLRLILLVTIIISMQSTENIYFWSTT